MYCFDVPLEQFGREPHLLRRVRGVVDDGIPVAPFQRVDLPVAIADQLLDAGIGLGIALAAIEQRERVAAGLERIDEVRADEAGAAEDENLLRLGLRKRGVPSRAASVAPPRTFNASRRLICMAATSRLLGAEDSGQQPAR